MLDHRSADRANDDSAAPREPVDPDLRPLLDHLARLLAEEFHETSGHTTERPPTREV
jgi:hypothetical protein